TPGTDGISLREAILASNNTPGANTITFDPGQGAFDMHIMLTQGELAIFNAVTITGQAEGTTTVDAQLHSRIFRTNSITGGFPAPPVTLDRLTLINGDATKESFPSDGGAIWHASGGLLTVSNCTISGNTARDYGGGIYCTGAVTVSSSTISGNSAVGDANQAGYGGGIYSDGPVTIRNSIVAGNVGLNGPDLYTGTPTVTYSLI